MIGERLAQIRLDHGDTQAALAKKLSVTTFTVSSWEQEKSSPNHETLVSICKLYEVSADFLLGLSDIDPAYTQRRRLETFSREELESLAEYEKFLMWKRKKQSERP